MAEQKPEMKKTQETTEDPMRKFCKEHGIRYLPDEPDHPIHKRVDSGLEQPFQRIYGEFADRYGWPRRVDEAEEPGVEGETPRLLSRGGGNVGGGRRLGAAARRVHVGDAAVRR